MSKVNILIVEDEPLVAEDIAGHLEFLGFGVASIVHSGEDALEYLKTNKPEAALLDITLSGTKDGIEVAEYINQNNKIPFVYLTSHADRSTIERVKSTHPGGYLVKPFDENDLLTCIELALANHIQQTTIKSELTLAQVNKKISSALSEREFEILLEMKSGKTNVALADSLFVSVNTIKSHLQNIYSKMDVRNRTEALFMIDRILHER
ncbi:MAG: response regulator transcription factor [Flavobacteriales bacterium]|nr:response regulator transcription factor [Flavobacteriales bacterium]